jgi:hypothetical protein
MEHVGEVLNSDTLRNIAGTSEWARRVRELRNEHGMDILTHNDRSDLKPGEYILASLEPLPNYQRTISKELRALILDRDGSTCQICGAVAGEPHPFDPTRNTRLHVGHIIDKSFGGTDEPSNLRALCSICNEGAANITVDRPSANKLLTQIRRATSADQIKILEWLIRKFPQETLERIERKRN